LVGDEGKKWPADIASTLNAAFGDKQGLEDQHINEGAPLFVPAIVGTICKDSFSGGAGGKPEGAAAGHFIPCVGNDEPVFFEESRRDGIREYGDVSNTLQSFMGTGGGNIPMVGQQPKAFAFDSLSSNSMKSSNPISGCNEVDIAKTIDTTRPDPSKNQGGNAVLQNMQVRRLTPRECERLQGFPDDYTAIPGAADGNRYKALGNSMAVPVMNWIGKRIGMVDEVIK
jgi:DNA (cytosine-5)-methyltransferase 1